MSFCPSCGSPVTPGTTSCSKCGSPAGAPSAPSPVSMPSPVSFVPPPMGMTGRLPDVSPLAIILALGAWVLGGPLLSVPALFIARSDIRGCREGRYNPAGLSQSQLAFWVAAINAGLSLLGCIAIGLFFLVFAGGMAAVGSAAIKHEQQMQAMRAEMDAKSYAALITQIDADVAKLGAEEQGLWKDVKKEWEGLKGSPKGRGAMPHSAALDALMGKVHGDARLWTAMAAAEKKVAAECGFTAPVRIRSNLPSEKGGDSDWDD